MRGAPEATADGVVIAAATFLCLFGVVMLYSATAPLAFGEPVAPQLLRHAGALLVGVAGAAFAMRLPLRWLRAGALGLWAVAVLLLVATAAEGVSANGAQRWLEVPGAGFRFQPGEPAKAATLLGAAALLARRGGRLRLRPSDVAGPVVLAVVPAGLLLLQPDLGNAVLLAGMTGLLLFAAGAPLRFFALPAVLGSALVGLYVTLRPYAFERVLGFLDPWAHASDEGFQLVQSFVAFGNGGPLGVGLGDGRQKLFYLPEAHTDFILSVVGEELGLLGVLAVLIAFAALLVGGLRIAARARDPFAQLAAVAMTLLVTVPAVVNAAVVTGLLPTKGLPLPFLSYGGTSLSVCCGALGVLLGIARHETSASGRGGSAFDRGGRPSGRSARTRP